MKSVRKLKLRQTVRGAHRKYTLQGNVAPVHVPHRQMNNPVCAFGRDLAFFIGSTLQPFRVISESVSAEKPYFSATSLIFLASTFPENNGFLFDWISFLSAAAVFAMIVP